MKRKQDKNQTTVLQQLDRDIQCAQEILLNKQKQLQIFQ